MLTGPGGYYEEPDYYHGPPDAGGYPPHGPPHLGGPPGPPGGNGNLVGYPPIRPSNRGGYGGGPPGMGANPPRSKHMVRLRGLPYSAQEKDITDFFQPLVPIRVNMDFDQFGRPSGEAEVFFQSHEDAQSAMKKNNQHIGEPHVVTCKLLCIVLINVAPEIQSRAVFFFISVKDPRL